MTLGRKGVGRRRGCGGAGVRGCGGAGVRGCGGAGVRGCGGAGVRGCGGAGVRGAGVRVTRSLCPRHGTIQHSAVWQLQQEQLRRIPRRGC